MEIWLIYAYNKNATQAQILVWTATSESIAEEMKETLEDTLGNGFEYTITKTEANKIEINNREIHFGSSTMSLS